MQRTFKLDVEVPGDDDGFIVADVEETFFIAVVDPRRQFLRLSLANRVPVLFAFIRLQMRPHHPNWMPLRRAVALHHDLGQHRAFVRVIIPRPLMRGLEDISVHFCDRMPGKDRNAAPDHMY